MGRAMAFSELLYTEAGGSMAFSSRKSYLAYSKNALEQRQNQVVSPGQTACR
jgi:hypothetical protein